MNSDKDKRVSVKDIVRLFEQIAPSHLSEAWDNCGLQVGSLQWEIKKIWVSLDPLISVLEAGGRCSVDMVITHHPLIFKALKQVDLDTLEGKVIGTAIKNRTAIYAAHTNLDSAAGGINDVLAQKIGLANLTPLVVSESDEIPAEKASDRFGVGLGRLGELSKPVTVKTLAGLIKEKFGLKHIIVAGNLERVVYRAAVCSGSGGGLIDTFLKTNADVYISGDLRYHDARTVEGADRAFIDIGHFASEHIIIDALVAKLDSAVQRQGWDVQIKPCKLEKDPFELL